ncbi:MAG: hypothetical protein OXI10_06250 [Gammaproteobacteria bacterium]|nr:hypothetical protein [Gammaproteobacteria bacterium]
MIADAARKMDTAAAEKYIREVIAPAVAARYGWTVSEILGHAGGYAEDERNLQIAWARNVAIWMAWHLTRLDDGTICHVLGGFPHWASEALEDVKRVMEKFPEIGENLREFFQEVHSGSFGLLHSIDELDRAVRRAE